MPSIKTCYKNKKLYAYSYKKGLALSIGRLPDNDIVIDTDADILLKGFMVGNITVMITKTGSGYYLSCQGKKKGAKVNGRAVQGPTKLADSDVIKIGSIKLVFHNL